MAVGWRPQFLTTPASPESFWRSSEHSSWFPCRESNPRENKHGQNGSFSPFYNLSSKETHHHSCHTLQLPQLHPSRLEERTTGGCEYHKAEVTSAVWDSLLHPCSQVSTSLIQRIWLALADIFTPRKGRTDERMAHKNSQNKVLNFGNDSRRDYFSKEISLWKKPTKKWSNLVPSLQRAMGCRRICFHFLSEIVDTLNPVCRKIKNHPLVTISLLSS